MEENNIKQDIGTASTENAEKKPALPPHKEYAKRMVSFKNKYMFILVTAAIIIGAGIALAFFYELIVGIGVAVLGVIFYARYASNDMYDTLGIDYKTYEKGLAVTICRAKYGDVIWVPAKLIKQDVTRIEDGAFNNKHNGELRCVFLPKTLLSIGKDVFEGCDALETIFFEGTEKEWEAIEKKTDFSALSVTFEAKYPPVKKKAKEKKAK